MTSLFVPGDSSPGNELPPVAVTPLIVIVKSEALAVPPLSLTTCLITIRRPVWYWYWYPYPYPYVYSEDAELRAG